MKWGEGVWIISESRDINLWERGQVWRPVPSGEERPGLPKAGVCPCDPCCHIADAAAGRWHDGLSPGAGAKLRLAKGQGSGVRLELREGQDLRSGLEGTGCLCWGGRERTVPESSSWAVLGSSPPGPGPGAPPCPPGYRSTLGHRPDPFTMRVVSGVYPQLRLLLLLLLAPHSHEGGLPPQRRFEYKLSFKGPRLALPGAGIPFWSQHGDVILGPEEVRLVPSMQNRSGAVWGTVPVLFSAWEVEVQMRVTGPGRQGAQGMAVWYTQGRGHIGSVLGGLASWDGIGILFDSSAKDSWSRPAIRVLASDGHTPDEQLGWSPSARRDGGSRELGSCHRDFRNRPHPLRVRITYWGQRLQVSVNNGLIPNGPEEVCVDVGPLFFAPGGFFGVSAATSTLADDHDVLSFLTFSLSELGPQPPHQPFLEMEQLRLARQLEGLWARLALRAKEDVMPKLSSETQSEEAGPPAGLCPGQRLASGTADSAPGPAGDEGCSCPHGLQSPGLLLACGYQASFLRADPDPEPSAERPSGPSEIGSQGAPPTRPVPRGLLMSAAWHLPVLPPHPGCRLLLLCTLQAGGEQEPSGLFVHRQPSSESCAMHP
nr:protein ERGIC-53-like isoform X9 [Manis javanica]